MTRWLAPLVLLASACSTADARHDGPVEVHVRGAMRLAIHCGGDRTVHARGTQARFVPDGPRCRVEARLSPVMPVRGKLVVTEARAYTCTRHGMALTCRPDGA